MKLQENTKKNILSAVILLVALSLYQMIAPAFMRSCATLSQKWNNWRAKRNEAKKPVTA